MERYWHDKEDQVILDLVTILKTGGFETLNIPALKDIDEKSQTVLKDNVLNRMQSLLK